MLHVITGDFTAILKQKQKFYSVRHVIAKFHMNTKNIKIIFLRRIIAKKIYHLIHFLIEYMFFELLFP